MEPMIRGDQKTAYRDPACYYFEGNYYLFFTKCVKEEGYLYGFVAMSVSSDLKNWSEPRVLTEKDRNLNFCSPGNIIKHGEEYVLCVTSYPMPQKYETQYWADETARLYLMRTKDFKTFTQPELIRAKGDVPAEEMGRMIDPYILEDKDVPGTYWLFYKQDGVSMSCSQDLKTWAFQRKIQGGENACVLVRDGKYLLIHSPENGIGFRESEDLVHWTDLGSTVLKQEAWDWAAGRLTAGFAMEARSGIGYKYVLFFHGSVKDSFPETHGGASIGMAFTDDFKTFSYEG